MRSSGGLLFQRTNAFCHPCAHGFGQASTTSTIVGRSSLVANCPSLQPLQEIPVQPGPSSIVPSILPQQRKDSTLITGKPIAYFTAKVLPNVLVDQVPEPN
ncbi:hypothetical protein ACH5RR_036843 [Cinchona calisaya]|uniref:Uncharacterized protein n=1 Tax=Cinchona calisaya TaxID=153742 RepID=A0ABD2Y4F0_9GENT